ncbi:MAG TPA: serine hydrolase domain-containing protein, partial [Longimicrobiaceae bacterium]|nr:serine hydrolase domain-containing protein [Longimicrobiaceae bacterium]
MALSTLTACGVGTGSDPVQQRLLSLDLESRVAQLIAIPADLPSLDAADSLDRYLSTLATSASTPGMIWLESGDAAAVARFAARARAWPVPVLLAAGFERGLGERISHATPLPPISVRGEAPDDGTGDDGARLLAREASLLGIDLGILRLTLPDPAEPAPFPDVERLEERLRSTVRTAASAGFPLGVQLAAPTSDSTATPWSPARARVLEQPLLRSVAATPAAAILLDPTSASFSYDYGARAGFVRGELRREIGWEGIIILDLRAFRSSDPTAAAVAALRAGADLLIADADPGELIRSLAEATRRGELPAWRVDEAARRILTFKLGRIESHAPVAEGRVVERLLELPRGRTTMGRDLTTEPAGEQAGVLHRAGAEEVGMSEEGLRAAERAIMAAIEDSVITAAALAVGRGGRLVRLGGYGALPDGRPVDPGSTLFDLASLSKVIGTATAVGMLLDSGRLSLETRVASVLREFGGGEKDQVTVRHLLAHTSGLPPGLWLYGSASSLEQAISHVLRQPLRRPPGEAPEYSDLGMIVLAEMIERRTEESLDDFLARNLFVPLGMSQTMYLPPVAVHGRIVPTAVDTERPYPLRGVVHDGNAFRLGGVAGHAGIFSTARDVAVFAQTMLNGGAYGPVEILADSTVRALTRRQPGADGRALGWDTPADRSSAGRFFSSAAYGHTGYTGTSLWIDPERDLFVVLLTNRTY